MNGGRNYNGQLPRAVVKPGYMLETPSIPRYLSWRNAKLVLVNYMIGKNATGADNQQERPGSRFRESSETTRQALSENSRWEYAKTLSEDIVRPPWRHGEPGRNDLAANHQLVVTICLR